MAEMTDTSRRRLETEIKHGKYLVQNGPGEIWNWESPAGKIRWARRTKMLSSHLRQDDKVLELGCGSGYFTKELAKLPIDLVAIDISPSLLEVARKSIVSPRVQIVEGNAYDLDFADHSFDSVVGSSVLHHLECDAAIRETYRVLKPGGWAVFTEPNMMNPQIAVQKNVPAIKRYLGDSDMETAFFKWSLKRELLNHGFSRVQIDPFDFLHPSIPSFILGPAQSICGFLENLPLIQEIAGSLYIRAQK